MFLGGDVNIFFSVAKEKAANTCDANKQAANKLSTNNKTLTKALPQFKNHFLRE
jgi:hypothetical protein